MATENFLKSLNLVLASEGGYVNHPRDPGKATNLGITIATLAAWRGKSCADDDVQRLTKDEAAAIYQRKYWDNISGDYLPTGLDYAVFDYAVNSGPATAGKALQGVIGAKQDGIIGAFTVKSVEQYIKLHGVEKLINALCDRRLSFLKSLPTWLTFGKGWRNRVEKVRREAIGMARG